MVMNRTWRLAADKKIDFLLSFTLIPKDATRKIKGKWENTKGKLKGADGKHFNTNGNKGKSKKTNWAKQGSTQGNICGLPVTYGVNGTLSAQSPVPPSKGFYSTWRLAAHQDIDFLL